MTTNDRTMTLEQAFEFGVLLYQQQKKYDARQVFEQILNTASDSLPVLQVLAVLDAEEGLLHEAIRKLDHALSIEPGNASILFDKAHLLTKQGMNTHALDIVDNLLSITPGHLELLSLRQHITASAGKIGDSRRTARKMANSQHQNAQILNDDIIETLALAAQMIHSGNPEQAKLLYQAVLSVAGELPQALIGLAKLQLAEENYGLARQTLLRSHKENSPDCDIFLLLSHCDIKLEQYKSARNRCRLGLRHWSDEARFGRLIVQSYEKEQNWIEAYRTAFEHSKQYPNDPDLLYLLAFSSFNLLKKSHNFTQDSIIQCKNHIEHAISFANDHNKDRLSTYLAEVLWYSGDATTAKMLLEDYITRFPNDIEAGFNISFVYRTLNEWENFYRSNELGITCGRRLRYNGSLPQWNLDRPKSDIVLVMPEQGVGDEILYFHNINLMLENCSKVYVACDPRLESILSNAFPSAIMVPVKRINNEDINLPEHVLSAITSWIPGGSLAALCFTRYGRHIYQSSYINILNDQKKIWNPLLDKIRASTSSLPLIGICWRSGLAAATRNMHYLVADEVAYFLKQCPNAIFINLQYGDCTKELNKIYKLSGVRILQIEGLDLRDDFNGTAAVIHGLDAVITAGTAVHRLTTAIGTPCHVFFASTADSTFDQPKALFCDNEFGYFYPPMIKNKYPLLESMANHMMAKIKQNKR